MMAELGYAAEATVPVAPPGPVRLLLREAILRAAVEYRSLRRDPNAVSRWRRDATVLYVRARLVRTS
jgi:hypothetical protein